MGNQTSPELALQALPFDELLRTYQNALERTKGAWARNDRSEMESAGARQLSIETEMRRRIEEADKPKLVFLVYADNCCYTTVTEQLPEGVEINHEEGTWTYAKDSTEKRGRVYKIGDYGRTCERGARRGIIGVFDAKNVQHLNAMTHTHSEATKSEDSLFD